MNVRDPADQMIAPVRFEVSRLSHAEQYTLKPPTPPLLLHQWGQTLSSFGDLTLNVRPASDERRLLRADENKQQTSQGSDLQIKRGCQVHALFARHCLNVNHHFVKVSDGSLRNRDYLGLHKWRRELSCGKVPHSFARRGFEFLQDITIAYFGYGGRSQVVMRIFIACHAFHKLGVSHVEYGGGLHAPVGIAREYVLSDRIFANKIDCVRPKAPRL